MSESRHTRETVRAALYCISPDCDREQWVRVLAAIKSELGEDGRALAQEWSSQGSGYNAADFRATWKSLKSEGRVTIGTLLALAKAAGFVLDRVSTGGVATPDRRAERAASEAKEEALRAAKRKRAAAEARRRFEAASEAGASPYLERKRVGVHGVRIERDGSVLVPMCNAAGELCNLQRIPPRDKKRFLPGPAVDLFHWLGIPEGAPIVALAEGYATAAAVHEASGLPVACAFSADNLVRVARLVRDRWPRVGIVLCADDDRETAAKTGRNPGRRKASEASGVGRAVVAVPAPLEAAETDFCDLAQRAGREAVAAIIRDACTRLQDATDDGSRPGVDQATVAAGDEDEREEGPFRVTDRGVYFLARERDGGASPKWVCGPLEVEARTRDADGSAWGYLLAFADPEGTHRRIAVAARLFAGDGAELRARLLDEGLPIAVGADRGRLAHYIVTRRPGRLVRCVETIGWHDDGFVLPGKSYGPGAADLHYQTADERPRNGFRQAGTLDAWRREVAALCIGNPRLAFLVALAFAGPCVQLVEAQSGGFHYFGQSSKGKTTALAVGASVWGRPELGGRGFIRTWRSTGNAIEATAAAHCDVTLFLDEIREADARELVATALMLGNGAGKQRMRSGGAQRPSYTWRVLYASTGERTIAESAALAGVPVDAGAGVRLVEIPIPETGAFDELHGARDGAAFSETIRAAALRSYGVAGEAWLEYLTAHRDKARTFLSECAAELTDAWRENADAGQTQRVAGRFALVAAAGELATRAGITGWPAGEAERAAHALFASWARARGTRGDAEALSALRQVAGLLSAHAESYFPLWHRATDDHRPNSPRRWGLRRLEDEAGNVIDSRAEREAAYGEGALTERQAEQLSARFYVLLSAWRGELCKGLDPRYVAGVLRRRGYLVPESDKPGARADRKERLPGIGSARCIVIKPSIFEDPAL